MNGRASRLKVHRLLGCEPGYDAMLASGMGMRYIAGGAYEAFVAVITVVLLASLFPAVVEGRARPQQAKERARSLSGIGSLEPRINNLRAIPGL